MKDWSLQICIDYESLNPVAICKSFSVQIIGKYFYSTEDAYIFSVVSANRYYWCMKISDNYRDSSEFVS